MTIHLLDTNLLIALLWPAHAHHDAAQRWFRRIQRAQWATCPLTQSGFVRIISNPKFSRDAVPTREAAERLAANLGHARHRFLPAAIPFSRAVAPLLPLLRTSQQTTDAYLLGLAMHHGARLATFDQGVRTLAPEGSSQAACLELLAPT